MIKRCDAQNLRPQLEKVCSEILNRLQQANERLTTDKDCEIHGNLCIVLGQVIEKFEARKILDVASLADQIMS